MWELRWVLIILGLVVIGCVYWISQRRGAAQRTAQRSEPTLSGGDTLEISADGEPPPKSKAPQTPDRVVTLRLVAHNDRPLSAEQLVIALRKHGLRHGKYGIFHREGNGNVDQPVFSVASLVEPGSFDLSKLKETELPGVSLFMVLPSPVDGVTAFDDMVHTARELAQEFEVDLFDEQGSSWSFQRERYVREEIIQYRHHTGPL